VTRHELPRRLRRRLDQPGDRLASGDDPVMRDRRDVAAQDLAALVGGDGRIDADGQMRWVLPDGGVLVDGDPIELAQRLWATIHGAVSLESRAICFAPSTDQHFDALVDTVLAGLRPEHALAGGRVSR